VVVDWLMGFGCRGGWARVCLVTLTSQVCIRFWSIVDEHGVLCEMKEVVNGCDYFIT
jgi:hypothetical protein